MKIARDTLKFILEVSRSSYPLEFAGMLQAKEDVITDVIIVPGTESGEESAVMQLFMLPSIATVGTVHSHPAGNINPSSADLELFDKKGKYHIIAGAPYHDTSWRCYGKRGEKIRLEVVDYEFRDEEW